MQVMVVVGEPWAWDLFEVPYAGNISVQGNTGREMDGLGIGIFCRPFQHFKTDQCCYNLVCLIRGFLTAWPLGSSK